MWVSETSGSIVLFTENYINTHQANAWTAIARLSVIWSSELSDKIKPIFPGSSRVYTESKTIQIIRTRHTGPSMINKNELISDVLHWIPLHWRASIGRSVRTYLHQLCADTGCRRKDLPKEMDDRDERKVRVGEVRASGTTWWWWWWYSYV